ncbi:molybdenum cofactor guanylyltransferase MobA [Szabonella alba]|uniref:Molybdenum cofactor guanylyltransferase n=1 Tax=Szabonella alba TaxID=2804194 RepID=A0A8K0Y0Z8_9RHOB|nr:molybdenum cofactor guanylyltransferase MobA [Szabonella alba]MBL4917643.1 molybdenum cofactor guanylyltransferase MobA [Szabonella alba]
MTEGQILGVVLAGGQARRMGGGDKGSLDLGGTRLIDQVIHRLHPQCAALVISANGDPARFAGLRLPVIADSIAGFAGPLAGVLAGMDHAAECGLSHVVTAAADSPFLPPDLVLRLCRAAQRDGKPIALAASETAAGLIRQPAFGLWPVVLREDLRAALGEGVAKIVIWAGRHGFALAGFDATGRDPFLNVNTPEDLETARHLWRDQQQG